MPLPYSLFQPVRYTQKDRQWLEARKKEFEDYNTAADAYNKALEAYNAGNQETEFTQTPPTLPTTTEEELTAYQKAAGERAKAAAGARQTAIIAAVNPEKYNLAGFGFADGGLVDIDSLSVTKLAEGGPVGEMSSAQPVAIDGPLSMALGGLIDINSLSVTSFAQGGEVDEDKAYTDAEIAQMRQAIAQSQPQRQEQQAPMRQAVKRRASRPMAQGPQQQPLLARQQLYSLPPYSLDMTGKLGQAGPIRRQEGSPPEGEVSIAEQMTVGTLPESKKDRSLFERYLAERERRANELREAPVVPPKTFVYSVPGIAGLPGYVIGNVLAKKLDLPKDVEEFFGHSKSRGAWNPEGLEEIRTRANGSPEEGEVAQPPELKATPQNPMLGFIAKALRTREEATKDLNSPTASLLNLILPTSQTVEKWSYGDPLFRMPPSGTGGYVPVTSRDKGYVAETIGYAPIGLPAKAVASGAMVGPPLGVIRPKGGGNLLSGDFLVEKTIDPLRPTVIVPDNKGQPVKVFASEQAESLRDLIARQKSGNYSSDYGESVLKEIEPQAALDDWIKNKFGNYIKKQMGTEDDPIRKLADEMSEKVQADYQAGLKRIAKMKEDIAKAKAKGKRTDVSEAELADEIDRVEQAFQETSILPSQLGPYTHVSASLGEAREKAGFSPYETAKSMQGKAYEELADTSFVPITVGEFKKKIKTGQGMGPGWSEYGSVDLEANPWISKLKDEDVLYRIRPYDINEKQVFTHTIDELRNALNPNSGLPQNLLLKPEDMQGLGIEKAFRHVNKINDWRMQQRVAANLEEAKRSAVTIKEYPDTPKRLKWQQLRPMEYTELPPGYRIEKYDYRTSVLKSPDGSPLSFFDMMNNTPDDIQKQALQFLSRNDLEKALQYEGSTMRHCVGGYCDSVWTGETNIFSLRDKKGEPHVTIETAPPDIRRDGNTPLDFLIENPSMASRVGVNEIDLAQMNVSKDLDQRAMELGIGRMPSVLSVETNRNIIKLPEFQEWLRSKPSEILQIKGKGNAKPKEDYIPFVQDFIKSQQWSHIGDYKNANITEISPTGKFAMDLKRAGYDVPRYITDEEFDRLADIRDALLDQSKKNQ